MRRTSFGDADCPVARSLDVIGDWWSLLIVRDAFDGIRRFSQFKESLGIARGMLTARLRALVEAGVLTQVAASDGLAYQEYVLTPAGEDLFPVIVALRQWGEAHLFQPDEPRSALLDVRSATPVAALRVRDAKGRALRFSDTRVQRAASQPRRGRMTPSD